MGTKHQLVELHRDEIVRIARSHRATSISLIGSVARNEDTDRSDVDFLVELEPNSSLFDLGGIQYDLAELLGVSVDVIERRGLTDRYEDTTEEALPL